MLDNLTEDLQGALFTSPAAAASGVDSSMPWHTQPYSIKRHGLSITNCDAEPVRAPGCIQAHGALLVLRLSDLSILQASENTQAIFGHEPQELLGKSVTTVIKSEGEIRLRSILATEPTDRNPTYVFTQPEIGRAHV